MKFTFQTIILLLALMVGSLHLKAQNTTSPLGFCDTEAHRQFNFWIGSWNVYNPDKTLAGTNTIKLLHGKCVIQENWIGASGGTGQSFNTYDTRTKTWHQVWVDSWGQRIDFSGKYEDRQMKLTGESYTAKGEKVYYKLTFFNNEDGTVRQLWESSTDKKEWEVIFDGKYIRKTE